MHPRDLASLAGEETIFGGFAAEKLKRLQAELEPLSRRYDVVVANPPYMGSSNMNGWVSKWVKSNYPTAKSDLCTCFFERGQVLAEALGYISMIMASSWMFISSFEKFRKSLLSHGSICSMIQQSTHGYAGVTVPTTMFVYACNRLGVIGSYIRLEDFDRPQWQEPRALEALANPDCGWFYRADASGFEAIPGSPIAYWASKKLLTHFKSDKPLSAYTEPRQGFATGDNNRFLRNWWEPSIAKSNLDGTLDKSKKWYPCNKGGGFRKWFGNNELVVNWANDGIEIKSFGGSVIRNPQYYFRKGMTWGTISSGKLSMRFSPKGFLFESKGSVCFPLNEDDLYIHLALANACTAKPFLEILCPTLDFHEGPIGKIPAVLPSANSTNNRNEIESLVKDCIDTAKADWDAFELSFDFEKHPLLR